MKYSIKLIGIKFTCEDKADANEKIYELGLGRKETFQTYLATLLIERDLPKIARKFGFGLPNAPRYFYKVKGYIVLAINGKHHFIEYKDL